VKDDGTYVSIEWDTVASPLLVGMDPFTGWISDDACSHCSRCDLCVCVFFFFFFFFSDRTMMRVFIVSIVLSNTADEGTKGPHMEVVKCRNQ